MKYGSPVAVLTLLLFLFYPSFSNADDSCIECHRDLTPGIVGDWELSAHAENEIGCNECHGDDHKTAEDVANVGIPTLEVCAECHEDQVGQFRKGKHAIAWAVLHAMPTTHYKPMELISGMKGCGGCHKIGVKSEGEIQALKDAGETGFGIASCDACHTRHLFSAEEARQPQACQTCHMGFDHPQWEMYSTSKHGVRALLV